jgi:hypothetical protein
LIYVTGVSHPAAFRFDSHRRRLAVSVRRKDSPRLALTGEFPAGLDRIGQRPFGAARFSSRARTTSTAKTAAWEKAAAHWEVKDGAIRGCDAGPGYLASDRTFKNFVLSLEFKAGRDTNSGVFIRDGYEVQIWTDQADGYNTGAIVNVAKTAKHYDFKAGRWNTYLISAEGDHITVLLNGETTLDIHDSKFASGPIRLQYWDYLISFRKVKIRELP